MAAGQGPVSYAGVVHLGLIAIVVSEYDPAISFFVDGLGFELVEDSPAQTNDGRPKRWVVVRPPGAAAGLLLAQADGEDQAVVIGKQIAGRVGFFLQVDDCEAAYRGWHPQACGSSRHRAPNRMAASLYFSASPATNGTFSARMRKCASLRSP